MMKAPHRLCFVCLIATKTVNLSDTFHGAKSVVILDGMDLQLSS